MKKYEVNNEFTKSDLELCMVVEFRDGTLYIVSNSKDGICLVNKNGNYILLEQYDKNLICIDYNSSLYDIMRVYHMSFYMQDDSSPNLISERT